MRSARARWVSWCAVVAFLAGGLAGAAAAQEEPPAGGSAAAAEPAGAADREAGAEGTAEEGDAGANDLAAPAAAPPAPAPAAALPHVVAVHRLLVEEAGEEEMADAEDEVPAQPVGLGGVIAVEVAGLDAFLDAAGGFDDVVLFLDGMPLGGLSPRGIRPDRGWLIFKLDRTEDDDESWHLLLGGPKSLVRKLAVSVGASADEPLPTEVEDFPLAVIHGWEMALFLVLLLVAVIGFLFAAVRTDLLRDRAAEVPGARCGRTAWRAARWRGGSSSSSPPTCSSGWRSTSSTRSPRRCWG